MWFWGKEDKTALTIRIPAGAKEKCRKWVEEFAPYMKQKAKEIADKYKVWEHTNNKTYSCVARFDDQEIKKISKKFPYICTYKISRTVMFYISPDLETVLFPIFDRSKTNHVENPCTTAEDILREMTWHYILDNEDIKDEDIKREVDKYLELVESMVREDIGRLNELKQNLKKSKFYEEVIVWKTF